MHLHRQLLLVQHPQLPQQLQQPLLVLPQHLILQHLDQMLHPLTCGGQEGQGLAAVLQLVAAQLEPVAWQMFSKLYRATPRYSSVCSSWYRMTQTL